MKSILLFFKDFKFARKRLGGTWYEVLIDYGTGFSSSLTEWQQVEPRNDAVVIRIEKYDIKTPINTTT